MATKEKRHSLKKKSKCRQTPRDIEIKGTFEEKPPKPKKEPRKRTKEEKHADDYSPEIFGQALANLSRWIPMFRSDLAEMNRNKVGRPYEFSDSMIYWLMILLAATGCSIGFVAGLFGGVLKNCGMKAPSRTRLLERMTELSSELLEKNIQKEHSELGDGYLALHVCSNVSRRIRDVSIDSSGMNLSSELGWRKKKWKSDPVDKGWLKLHSLCDVDSGEVIAYAITTESVGDAPVLRKLVEMAAQKGHIMGKIYGDGAYSSDDNWIFLTRENSYEFITSFKSNTVPTCNGCSARGKAAALWCSTPYQEWTEQTGYGKRWKSECGFSDLKRMFGETVSAKTDAGANAELFGRLEAFNMYKRLRAKILKVTGNGVTLV